MKTFERPLIIGNICVRKIRLIQPMVITLEEEGVKKVMIFFYKFKISKCKRQIYASI